MIKTIHPSKIPQAELHGYLLSAVAPRPICFASTIDKDGNVNLSPFSFFNVFSSNPPLMIFSPARRGRDNTTKHTYENVKEVPEVVINIVNYPMIEQMSLSSTEYDKGVNEFVKAGFTEVASEKVTPPRVGEAPVSFECSVQEVIELANAPGAGNLVLAKVELIHINYAYLDANNVLDTHKLDLVARMGGSWYCHANGDALFEIPKPLKTKGIGVDSLPEYARNSTVLTGNDLGRLGNLETLPDAASIESLKQDQAIKDLIDKHKNNTSALKIALESLAKEYLKEGNPQKALAVLMLHTG